MAEITITSISGPVTLEAEFVLTQSAGELATTESIEATNQQNIVSGELSTAEEISGNPTLPISAGALQTSETLEANIQQQISSGDLSTTESIDAKNQQNVVAGEMSTTESLAGAIAISELSAGDLSTTESLSGAVQIISTDGLVPLYKLVLTGSADGTTDITIPISSFQMRMYDGRPTYLSVAIPNIDYADEITARSNGNLDLYLMYAEPSDLTDIVVETRIVIVKMGVPSLDNGSVNKSVTLTGYETTAQRNARQADQKTIYLDGSWFNYMRTSGGLITARMVKPHLTLRAGDTVGYDGSTFTASLITWIEAENYSYMEIAEAA